MKKNVEIASNVLHLVGGKENVINIFHCATRLRFNLKDNGLVDYDSINAVKGVMGTHTVAGEVQVIIGPAVDDVYNEIVELAQLEKSKKIDEDLDTVEKDRSIKGYMDSIVSTFSACMNPLVPIFVLMGMLNVIAAIIGPTFLNLVSEQSDIYTNFYYAGQAIIYFLPILIAVTASKHFKTNVYISLVLSFILLYPDLVALMSEGIQYTVYGIPAAAVTYSASVIPIMLIIWVQSYVAQFINKYTPNTVKLVLVPLLTVLVMLPISLCVLGPLGNYIGVVIANGIMWLRDVAGPLETMLVAAFIPFMTALGIGRPIFFICLTSLLTTGSEFAYLAIAMVINNWIVMGVSAGYFFKSKKKEDKQLGASCFITTFLAGVSEPAVFGILLPNKKLYIPTILGGAIAGLYLGIMNVGYYQFGPSNFIGAIGFINGNTNNFLHGCIASAIAIICTFVLVLVMYKEEEKI